MSSVSNTISLPGLGTGIDTAAIISQLIASASGPLNQLKAAKSTWQSRSAAISSVQQAYGSLQAALNELRNAASLDAVSAASSDTTVATLTAGAGASAGNHQVEVNQLARSARLVQQGLASADTLVGAGQFVYSYNGVQRTITTTDQTKLSDLVNLINNDSSNPGVTASLLNYQVDAGHAVHLVLDGRQTGQAYNITVGAGTNLAGFDGASFDVRAAQDAQVRVDGYPSGAWISRPANQISDIVPNVTIKLTGIGSAEMSLSANNNQITADLQNLVTAYNAVLDKVHQYASYDASTKTAGVLFGDYRVEGLLGQVNKFLTGLAPGFADGHDTFSSAAQIGLEIGKDTISGGVYQPEKAGRLSLDTDKLNAALEQDRAGVISLLSATGAGWTDSTELRFDSVLPVTKPGTYEVRVQYDDGGNITVAEIRRQGAAIWDAAYVNGNTITGVQQGSDALGLQVEVLTPGQAETKSYTVRVRGGLAAGMYEAVGAQTDATSGVFASENQEIQANQAQLDQQIQIQQDRLDREQERLKAQYARLEATLTQIQSFAGAYEGLFQSLGAGSSSSKKSS